MPQPEYARQKVMRSDSRSIERSVLVSYRENVDLPPRRLPAAPWILATQIDKRAGGTVKPRGRLFWVSLPDRRLLMTFLSPMELFVHRARFSSRPTFRIFWRRHPRITLSAVGVGVDAQSPVVLLEVVGGSLHTLAYHLGGTVASPTVKFYHHQTNIGNEVHLGFATSQPTNFN